MENLINKIWFVIDIFIIRDIILQLVVVFLLFVFLVRIIKDLKEKKLLNRPYYTDRFFYKFLKLQFLFIIVFLIHAVFLLGVLDHNIMECLITKYIISLAFFSWSLLIYSIDLIFTKRYAEDYNNTLNSDNVWNWVKLIITMVFVIYFGWMLIFDILYLFN